MDGAVDAGRRYLEAWVAADGTTWRRDTGPTGLVERYRFAPDSGSGDGSYSPGYLAELPTEPTQLYERLRQRVSGSSSQHEAVFVAVGNLLRTQMASAALRAAAVNALALLPVTVQPGAISANGRTGVLISMDRPHDDGTQALLVDERTSSA